MGDDEHASPPTPVPGTRQSVGIPEPPSRDLLLACKAQNQAAFRVFVASYQRAVFALLSRTTGPGAHVQDLAQEVFLRAFRAFPRFDVDGSARASTWLLTIAVRLALNARKGLSRAQQLYPLAEAEALPAAGTPESERTRRELGTAIAKAAQELSPEQRAIFVLSEFHGMSISEIANAVEIPEATVKTRLFRARAQLRERLASFWSFPRERSHGA